MAEQQDEQEKEFDSKTIDISFQHEGKSYTGWATASGKLQKDGKPGSFHVVLNDVFFGNLAFNEGKWEADSQREHDLVQAVGKQLNKLQ